MPSKPPIALSSVWKRYLLGSGRGMAGIVAGVLGRSDRRDRWAVADLDLQVGQGESVGLIGHNGAGKTTALKLVAGITRPTRGRVEVQGRVASLINLGAGFHRELSGRENVYLNGVLLGLSRAEVGARYEQIVAFSGLEAGALEAPVKQYSTGMYARLGFAVAAHADPEVLLVDEVLSVGDASFQDRSMRRMVKFRESGAAIVFVSHNLSAVEMMCQRVVWLEGGRVVQAGPTADVVRAYLDTVDQGTAGEAETDSSVAVTDVSVLDSTGEPTDSVGASEPFTIRVQGVARRALEQPVFVISIRADEGPLFAGNMHIDGNWPAGIERGPFVVACAFGPAHLAPGWYRVELKIKQNVRTNYYEPRVLARFRVGELDNWGAGAAVTHRWRVVQTGTTSSGQRTRVRNG